MTPSFDRRVGFAIGTGRCGTEFLARMIASEPSVAAVHERNPLNEAFHRYCKWYGLPVDDEGFLHCKETEIVADLAGARFSFEASAHLSLSVEELYRRFHACFVLLVRSPERVVNSYLRKGWYERPIVFADPHRALGYQPTGEFHHFLGRIVPRGEELPRWQRLSRVGKLAWYWRALNEAALADLERLPASHRRVQKLEELSFDAYRDLVRFLGFETSVREEAFATLVKKRPNALRGVPTIARWSAVEIAEFESEVAPLAERLGYEFRVGRLASARSAEPNRLRRMVGRLLR